MTQQDMKQYKVTRGNAKDSGISATYEYTSGNITSKSNGKKQGGKKENEG
ncbi:hypothetical protein H1D32_10340 [Anaerobacillus sp. CMMVII]|nr:hypothetical protein [Anaerobacillus sp. CMMVII]MCT8138119.1 hypothetical protein [Anaerobacillus sp. CMMVII]